MSFNVASTSNICFLSVIIHSAPGEAKRLKAPSRYKTAIAPVVVGIREPILISNNILYMYTSDNIASFSLVPSPSHPSFYLTAFSPQLRDKSWGGKEWKRG